MSRERKDLLVSYKACWGWWQRYIMSLRRAEQRGRSTWRNKGTIYPYYHHYMNIASESKQARGEHQKQQNLCNEEMRKSSFQEEIRKNSVTLVWGEAEKPFPLLRPQIADVVDSQPRTCAASSWGCVCVWKTLVSTARAAGTCRLLTMPCPEVKLTTKASETTGYGMGIARHSKKQCERLSRVTDITMKNGWISQVVKGQVKWEIIALHR